MNESRVRELLRTLAEKALPDDVQGIVDLLLMKMGMKVPPRKPVGAATREEFEKLRSEVASVAKIAVAIEKMGRGIRPEEVARWILEKIRRRARPGARTPLGGASGRRTSPGAKEESNPRLEELTEKLMLRVKQTVEQRRGIRGRQ